MRVLHCVTLVSPSGEFGGPTRVACNLAKELNRRGHQTVLVAGARGYDELPEIIDGVPSRLGRVRSLLPGMGFSGLVSPRLLRLAWTEIGRSDVVHVHLARDLITLPIALLALIRRVPIVVQPHGMVDASEKGLAHFLDLVATTRIMRKAKAVFYLSQSELEDLREVFGDDPSYSRLPNGVDVPEHTAPDRRYGPPRDVIFLARLAERKRPLLFIDVARQCVERGATATKFTLYGPDEGLGHAVSSELAKNDAGGRISWAGAIPPEAVAARLRAADLLVNTTQYDLFPMAVLEAMAVGVPVVIGESSPIATGIDSAGAGIAAEETADSFADAVMGFVDCPTRLDDASMKAVEYVRSVLSLRGVVDTLLSVYEGAFGEPSRFA